MSLRHDRRRLLIADESSESDAASAAPEGLAPVKSRIPRDLRQRRTLELVASRPGKTWAMLTSLFGVVAGLGVAHVYLASEYVGPEPAEYAALDLVGLRNVSQWFATLLLGFASLVALDIYSLRRLRVDDYHGRYRAWIWIALACLITSLVEATDVSGVVSAVCRRIAELSGVSERFVWHAVCSFPASVIGLRFLFEIRRSRMAMSLLTVATASFVFAISLERGWVTWIDETHVALATRVSYLVGYVAMLATFLQYARFVVLELTDAMNGVSSKRKRMSKKLEKQKATSTSTKRRADDEDEEAKSSQASRLRIDSTASRSAQSDEDEGDARSSLSRTERKRLRREARRAA